MRGATDDAVAESRNRVGDRFQIEEVIAAGSYD
jgi:hypothetical protein